MNCFRSLVSTIAATTLASFVGTLPAIAFSITQTSNSATLINALLGDTTGLSDFSITTYGDSRAFGTFTNGSNPLSMDSGIVLSTGRVTRLAGENTASAGPPTFPDLSADLSVNDSSTGHDIARLDISFFADSTADKLFFNFVFGSEEFLEYGGSKYNDSFELLLNGVNLAKLSDGQLVTINNLVPDEDATYHPDYINNPAGRGTQTRLDGFTTVLGFEGGVIKNSVNTLSIVIKDISDSYYDSAVFIQGGSLGTTQPPKATTPASASPSPEPVAIEPSPASPSPEPVAIEPSPASPSPEPVVIEPSPASPSPEPVAVAPDSPAEPMPTEPSTSPEPVASESPTASEPVATLPPSGTPDPEPTAEPVITEPPTTGSGPHPIAGSPDSVPSGGVAIPEPTSAAGLLVAGGAIVYLRRRKRTS